MTPEENTTLAIQDILLRRALRAQVSEEPATAATPAGHHGPSAAPFDSGIESGQIRLLAQTDELCHVLVLFEFGGDGTHIWVVVPFSPFSSPATDEEFFLGGGRTEYLDVLQYWNARSYCSEVLGQSWVVDTLREEELETAYNVWRWVVLGDTLPPDLRVRFGTPITDLGDPRLEYKLESNTRFGTVDELDIASYHTGTASPV